MHVYIIMSDTVGLTKISGEGLKAAYQVSVRLPVWGWIVAVVIVLLYSGRKMFMKEGMTTSWGLPGARGTARSDRGPSENMLNGRATGPDYTAVNADSAAILSAGIAAGGTDGSAAADPQSEGLAAGRPGKHSEMALERQLRGVA